MSELRRSLVPARHRGSLAELERERWLGSKEGAPPGNTQDALARLGVAETRWTEMPYGRQVARLTELGAQYLAEHVPAEEVAAARAARARRAR